MGTGAFDAFDFGTLNLPHTYRLSHVHHEIREVQIRPHQGQQLGHSQRRGRIAQGERAPRLRNVEENLERLLRRHGDRRVVAGRSLAHPIHGIALLLSRQKLVPLPVLVN
jgi:hypothetical protein